MSQSKRLPIESCMRLFWPLLPAGEWHRPTWNKKQKHHTPAREGFCCCCCRSHKHQKCHHIGYATAEGSPFSETALERPQKSAKLTRNDHTLTTLYSSVKRYNNVIIYLKAPNSFCCPQSRSQSTCSANSTAALLADSFRWLAKVGNLDSRQTHMSHVHQVNKHNQASAATMWSAWLWMQTCNG